MHFTSSLKVLQTFSRFDGEIQILEMALSREKLTMSLQAQYFKESGYCFTFFYFLYHKSIYL
jgi:hypothetical protein